MKLRMTPLAILIAVIASLAVATTASAAVTFDPTCPYTPSNGTGACGFVGKGNVQTALGYNNSQMQNNAGSLAFTYTQPASQALSQGATQAGTQAGTQSMSETLSCVDSNGRHTATRNGTRAGSREGARGGDRSGTRAGTLNGNVSYAIAFDPRVRNQINGFFLTRATSLGFVASGDPVWGDYSWDDWSWNDWSFGDTTWGDFVAAPGENPNLCNSGNPGITEYSDVVTPGDITPGDITPGDITPGDITPGVVTPTGSAALYVNGKLLN